MAPASSGRKLTRMGGSVKSDETAPELPTEESSASVAGQSLDPSSGDSQGPVASAAAKQFSTFRANRQNSRRLPGGISQLKLVESEVMFLRSVAS